MYPNCVGDKKKLGTTLELLQWKVENGVSDKGFGKLLVMIKDMLKVIFFNDWILITKIPNISTISKIYILFHTN